MEFSSPCIGVSTTAAEAIALLTSNDLLSLLRKSISSIKTLLMTFIVSVVLASSRRSSGNIILIVSSVVALLLGPY